MSKIDHSLFTAQEHALDDAYGDCPDCGEKLRLKRSKSGPFLGCSAYPQCHFSKPLYDNATTTVTVIEGSSCPECASELAIKKGRFGLFIGCTDFPQCHHIEAAKSKEVSKLACPSCHSGELIKRTSKFGKSFFACNGFPKCKYAVNYPPVASSCPSCDWPIMLERKAAHGNYLQCPQKACQHKIEK